MADSVVDSKIESMPRRRLGEHGPEIGVVGIGTWSMGGSWRMGWGTQSTADSVAALEAAFARGVDWVDTAPVYGLGVAERVLRAPLAAHPEVRVFSKAGFVGDSGVDLSPASVRQQFEGSLERLGRDRLDLYQLHWPDEHVPIESTWEAMCALRDEGLVGAIGISNHTRAEVERAHRVGRVDMLQLRYSLLDRRAEADLIPWALEHGAGVLAYSPLASGLLGGRFDPERMAADDWRRTDDRFQLELAAMPAAIEALRHAAEPGGEAAAAIAWSLAMPGITAAIAGVRRAPDVAGLVRAATLGLGEDAIRMLSEATESFGLRERTGRR